MTSGLTSGYDFQHNFMLDHVRNGTERVLLYPNKLYDKKFFAKHSCPPRTVHSMYTYKMFKFSSLQRGNTALHIASLHGQVEMCRLLIDRGSRINATCKVRIS